MVQGVTVILAIVLWVKILLLLCATENCFPYSWSSTEIIELCERLSGQSALVNKIPLYALRVLKNFTGFFEWGKNISDRLSFAEVLVTGPNMTADMKDVYEIFSFDSSEASSLERYMQDYFGRILRRLKELSDEKEKSL